MLSSEYVDGILIIRCHTDVVYERAEDFRLMLSRLLGGPETRVVLDLERTRFLCSTALGSIAATCARLRQGGGELVLAGLSADVDRVLFVTKLSNVIRIATDWEEAVGLLQSCPDPSRLSSS